MVDELGGLILPDYITPAWKRLLEKNNMCVIRFHDLRHTCASLLLNKGKHDGITLKDIQVWLGHSDFSTTANTYSHLDATSKVSSLSALSGAVSLAGCPWGNFLREQIKKQGFCSQQKPCNWRTGWDSNPRAGVTDKLISSQPRYDHFDTRPYIF